MSPNEAATLFPSAPGAAYAAVLLCAAPLVLAVAHLARGVGYLCGPAKLPPAPLARESDSSWAG